MATNQESDATHELGHVPILAVAPGKLFPSPENDELYKPVLPNDSGVKKLATSVRKRGVIEPIVATADRYVVSGHRRRMAAIVAGVTTVPVRFLKRRRDQYTKEEYAGLLRDFNRQRVKSFAEKAHEAAIDIDPEQAYAALIEARSHRELVDLPDIDTSQKIVRAKISPAKTPMVDAILKVIRDHRPYLPINVRKVHYELAQHHRPLKHASKPQSIYGADDKSYRSLTDLLTRLRLLGVVPHEAISDETRPTNELRADADVGDFLTREMEEFCKDYRRQLMQSQPMHLEVAVEKNTIYRIVQDVTLRYAIPITSLRGMPSMPAKHAIARRFRKSGKDRLVVLVASDFDPTGEAIAENLATSLRDEFSIPRIDAYKIAVTPAQAEELGVLHNVDGIDIKKSDSKAKRFRQRHGDDAVCYELEALSVAELQHQTREAIDQVIDIDLFNQELEQERQEALRLSEVRYRARALLRDLDVA